MVRGLDKFKSYFANFTGQYALIGGTACAIAFESIGQEFRATQDLDIVLHIEARTSDFDRTLWQFINDGDYQTKEKGSNDRKLYRFRNPKITDFPLQIELFSKDIGILQAPDTMRFTPIPTDEELSSLSAILMDDIYYELVIENFHTIDEISVVKSEYLIPLKVKAWTNLSEERQSGRNVQSEKIEKHRKDIFRLFVLLAPNQQIPLPTQIQDDMKEGLRRLEIENNIDQSCRYFAHRPIEEVLESLRTIYGLQ
ncbi:MAG: hypothetical protein R3F48_15390 [Candidatus Zixiibacteriota bacterium]